MFRSGAARLALPLLALLLLPLLSCDRGYPGAPEGYNFRRAHVVWKLTGNVRGTIEEYLETSGFKEGQLQYKRFAVTRQIEADTGGRNASPRKIEVWVINDQGVQYTVMKPLKRVLKDKVNLDQFMKVSRNLLWREVRWGLAPRKDLTEAQRDILRKNRLALNDQQLQQLGAKITSDTFLGHKVKRYEIPFQGGRGILLLYGDIPLLRDFKYTRFHRPFHTIMTATKLELNKPIPDAVMTPPKDYKVVDSSKKIPQK